MPPPLDHAKQLDLNLSIHVQDVIEINEKLGYFRTKMDINRWWIDQKLTYQNLKKVGNNEVTPQDGDLIWTPWTVFINIESKDKYATADKDPVKRVIPNPNFDFTVGDKTFHENTYLFKGSENKMNFEVEYTVEWLCDFHMGLYPFDSQTCTMEFLQTEDSINLMPTSAHYSGPYNLPQHTVKQVKMCNYIIEGRKGVLVEMTFDRPLFSTILTVALPTVILVMISQMATVFAGEYIDMVIQVNLTVLLVLATL